jgi:hypothetical protein
MNNKLDGQEKQPRTRALKKPATTKDLVAHVLVRVRSEDGKTVEAHRKVIAQRNCVLFAKIGKGLGSALIDQLRNQINRDVPTYLFVAIYEGWNEPFGIYQCELLDIHSDLTDAQTNLVPEYLHSVIKKVSTWFEIRSLRRVAQEHARRVHVLTSGREVSGALRGATAMFRVGITGSTPMKLVQDPPPIKKKQSDADSTEFDDDHGDDDLDYQRWIHVPQR